MEEVITNAVSINQAKEQHLDSVGAFGRNTFANPEFHSVLHTAVVAANKAAWATEVAEVETETAKVCFETFGDWLFDHDWLLEYYDTNGQYGDSALALRHEVAKEYFDAMEHADGMHEEDIAEWREQNRATLALFLTTDKAAVKAMSEAQKDSRIATGRIISNLLRHTVRQHKFRCDREEIAGLHGLYEIQHDLEYEAAEDQKAWSKANQFKELGSEYFPQDRDGVEAYMEARARREQGHIAPCTDIAKGARAMLKAANMEAIDQNGVKYNEWEGNVFDIQDAVTTVKRALLESLPNGWEKMDGGTILHNLLKEI